MIPYAYKDHELFKHLEGTANKALDTLNRLGYNVICNRFRKLGLEMDCKELEQIVRLSALLHDIGKAADDYQNNPKLENFYLHEVPSAVIAKRALEKNNIREECKDLIVITVLQHMNSMRDWMSSNREVNKGWLFSKFSEHILRFLNGKNIVKGEINLDVNSNDASKLIKEYQDKSRSNDKQWLKLYNLILASITVGDNLDAYETRKDNLSKSRRLFVEELMRLEEY
jgi:CRISPR-associated endonuclease Cas3-HD